MYRVNVVRTDKGLGFKPLPGEVLEKLTFDSIRDFIDKCYQGTMNERFNSKYGFKNWTYCDYKETPCGTFLLTEED